MPEPIVSEIRARLSSYLDGRISLREFRDWFAPVAWNIEASGDQSAIEMAYCIDGLLSESTSAGWSESGLMDELASAMRPVLVS